MRLLLKALANSLLLIYDFCFNLQPIGQHYFNLIIKKLYNVLLQDTIQIQQWRHLN